MRILARSSMDPDADYQWRIHTSRLLTLIEVESWAFLGVRIPNLYRVLGQTPVAK